MQPKPPSAHDRPTPESSSGGPRSAHDRKPKGSILIWSVLLGFVLTSVFLFFGTRQRRNVAIQRETAEILNQRAYLESYADYLQANPTEINTTFDNINVELTQYVPQIQGVADADAPVNYNFSDTVFIEWNRCSDPFRGDLRVNGALYQHDSGSVCGAVDPGFDDVASSLTVSAPFTIETANIPFEYKITGSNLVDNQWHLDLKTELDYGKTVTVARQFE